MLRWPAGFGTTGGSGRAAALPAPSTSKTAMGAPTGCMSPGAPCTSTTLPATGAVISTVALSVITSTSGWSSRTSSPTATCQATISASAVPSPTSGSLKT